MFIKKMVGFLVKMISVFIVLFVILGVFANYYKEQVKEERKPIWVSNDVSVNSDGFVISKEDGLVLKAKDNNLVLMKMNHLELGVLFTNYNNQFDYMRMYYKDLDQDGNKELVFHVDRTMYDSELYVFSNINTGKISKCKSKEVLWNGGRPQFTDKEQMYIRSCGSQYCNDTYYLWTGDKLNEEYTDSYESM